MAVLVGSAVACSAPGPVEVAVPRGGVRAERVCAALAPLLPERLDGRDARRTSPRSAATAAWGDPALVLRCGVPRPAGLRRNSQLVVVDGVAWFLHEGERGLAFTTVRRVAYVELLVPPSVPRQDATAPLVDLARPVRRADPTTG